MIAFLLVVMLSWAGRQIHRSCTGEVEPALWFNEPSLDEYQV